MKLPDRGSSEVPWVSFTSDRLTGISITDGKIEYLADGKPLSVSEWLWELQDKGHIDMVTRIAILAAMTARGGIVSALASKFSRG